MLLRHTFLQCLTFSAMPLIPLSCNVLKRFFEKPNRQWSLEAAKTREKILSFEFITKFGDINGRRMSRIVNFGEREVGWLESVWPDDQFIGSIFGNLQHWTFAQNQIIYVKVSSKCCQIVNEPFFNCQSVKTSYQSGEISPNLVTLVRVRRNKKERFELNKRAKEKRTK